MSKLISLVIAVLLSACSHINSLLPENRIVAAKCTNIDALLAKNVTASMNANLVVASGGVAYMSKGPEISGLQATILTQTNMACKSWALGAMSDEKWATFLDHRLAASIALSGMEDAASIKRTIEGVLATGESGDTSLEPNALASRIEKILEERARFQEQGLVDIRDLMEKQYMAVKESIDKNLSRLDRLASESSGQMILVRAAVANFSSTAVSLDQASLDRIKEVRALLEAQREKLTDAQFIKILDELEKVKHSSSSNNSSGRPLTAEDRANLAALAKWLKDNPLREEKTTSNTNGIAPFSTAIHFGISDGQVTFDGVEQLNRLLPTLKGRSIKLEIEGFSDMNGDSEKNLALSQDRARIVADIIEKQGISVGKVRGYGATSKFGPLHSQNRVVVVTVK
jgi:hypothetical protein